MLGLAPVAPHATRRYGPHPSQVVDYYRPDPDDPGAGRLTVLHGGFWREAYDRAHLSATAAALARRGFAVALAEYRRVGGGGGVPGTFEDVAAVVRTAWPGEPHVLLGHSAGGQLALWAAVRAGRAERVAGVVAVAPVADLGEAHRLRLSRDAVAGLLAPAGPGDPGVAARYDPVRLPSPPVPVVLLHGTADPDVPPVLSRHYAATHDAVLHELPGAGHYAALLPGSPQFERLVSVLRELAASAS
nr:alpha/beta fold hydrolase [Streptomyces sp. SID5468]